MGEACAMLQEVHDTQARVLGLAHEDTMSTKTTLASIYSAMERYEEAETYYEDILSHHTRQSSSAALPLDASEDHAGGRNNDLLLQAGVLSPNILHMLGEFSILLHAVGKYERAATMSSRCVRGYEKVYGDKAETTAWAQYNLACILDDVGDPIQALEVCEKCIRAFESIESISPTNGERGNTRLDSVRSLRDSLLIKRY
jgi:tetratricopeptide (TPR) repeat protein